MSPRTRSAPSRASVTLGPFVGMRDRRPASAPADEGAYYAYGENVWVRDPQHPTGVEPRPPIYALTNIPGARTPQGIYHYVSSTSAVRYLFLVAGGKVYRYDAGVWTDVTPVAPTINGAVGKVYLTTYNDRLIVNDGINRPWVGTNLGLTPIVGTNIQVDSASTAWSAYGPPAIYGGKLFFIRNNPRTRIVWSEEADEATGYEQTGYANYWNLTQTDPHPLYCLCATNDALYFFREHSIGAIYGTVASDFSSTATRDAVSLTLGTTAADSVCVVDNEVWFVDRTGLPHVLVPGGGIVPVYENAIGTLHGETIPTGNFSVANVSATTTRYLMGCGVVLFLCPMERFSGRKHALVFHAATRQCMGVWRKGTDAWIVAGEWAEAPASATDFPTILLGTSAGKMWYVVPPYYNNASTGIGQDYDVTTTTWTTIDAQIDTEPVLGNPRAETRWDLIAAALRIPTDASSRTRSFGISYRVPRATWSTPLTPSATALFDGGNARAVVGVLAQGRSIEVRITTTATSPGRFVLDTVALEGTAMPPNAVSY